MHTWSECFLFHCHSQRCKKARQFVLAQSLQSMPKHVSKCLGLVTIRPSLKRCQVQLASGEIEVFYNIDTRTNRFHLTSVPSTQHFVATFSSFCPCASRGTITSGHTLKVLSFEGRGIHWVECLKFSMPCFI